MSTTKVTLTSCDLCGYGGSYTRPEDFRQVTTLAGVVDLCLWCCATGTEGYLSSGRHVVTLEGGSWQCSCGEVYGSVVLRLRMSGVLPHVLDVPPSLARATANMHVQS
jgi:hypothetical protein